MHVRHLRHTYTTKGLIKLLSYRMNPITHTKNTKTGVVPNVGKIISSSTVFRETIMHEQQHTSRLQGFSFFTKNFAWSVSLRTRKFSFWHSVGDDEFGILVNYRNWRTRKQDGRCNTYNVIIREGVGASVRWVLKSGSSSLLTSTKNRTTLPNFCAPNFCVVHLLLVFTSIIHFF